MNKYINKKVFFTIFTAITLSSATITYADLQIRKNITDALIYMKQIVLTTNGLSNGTTNVTIDGSTGNSSFSGDMQVYGDVTVGGGVTATTNVTANELCIGSDCKTSWAGFTPWLENGTKVYYLTDNVGIGTLDPSEKLEVFGNIKANGGDIIAGGILSSDGDASVGGNLTVGSGVNAMGALSSPEFCLNGVCETSWPDSSKWNESGSDINYMNGSVGIGVSSPKQKLDVAGGVKIGDSLTTCDGTNAGAIRFNSGTFQGCNGTSWVALVNSNYTPDYQEKSSTTWGTGAISLGCDTDYKLVNAGVEYDGVHTAGEYTIWADVHVNNTTQTAKTDCMGSNCKLHVYCVK